MHSPRLSCGTCFCSRDLRQIAGLDLHFNNDPQRESLTRALLLARPHHTSDCWPRSPRAHHQDDITLIAGLTPDPWNSHPSDDHQPEPQGDMQVTGQIRPHTTSTTTGMVGQQRPSTQRAATRNHARVILLSQTGQTLTRVWIRRLVWRALSADCPPPPRPMMITCSTCYFPCRFCGIPSVCP